MSSQKRGRRIKLPLIAALVLLILLSAVNVKIVGEPLTALARHELTFEEFVNTVESGYSSDNFAGKSGFVNVNGLFARLTGRRVLNKVIRGTNGMLTGAAGNIDMTELAASIEGFAKYLQEYEDIPFLYVQLPYKEDLDGSFLPEGVTSCANQNADHLLSCLSAAGVNAMDMRPQLSQTPEMMQQYFYKTDHHWNPEGAFVAFREVMESSRHSFQRAISIWNTPGGRCGKDTRRKTGSWALAGSGWDSFLAGQTPSYGIHRNLKPACHAAFPNTASCIAEIFLRRIFAQNILSRGTFLDTIPTVYILAEIIRWCSTEI